MAAKSTLKNMVLCLTLVCLICSAILAVVFAMTAEPIKAAEKKALLQSLEMVLPQGGEISGMQTVELDGIRYDYYVSSVNGQPQAWAIKSSTNGFGGAITLMVGVQKGSVVYATKVLSHSETPGLGAKCGTDRHFIDQFEGFDATSRKLSVRKDGGDVDAITASTITSRAYTLAVEQAVRVAKSLEDQSNE